MEGIGTMSVYLDLNPAPLVGCRKGSTFLIEKNILTKHLKYILSIIKYLFRKFLYHLLNFFGFEPFEVDMQNTLLDSLDKEIIASWPKMPDSDRLFGKR